MSYTPYLTSLNGTGTNGPNAVILKLSASATLTKNRIVTLSSGDEDASIVCAGGLLAAPAGSLTGTTLASNVVTSSLTTVGTIGSGVWAGTAVAADKGGTGQTVYAVGDLLYASTTTALSKLADVATGSVLISGGIGMAPAWSTTPTFVGTNISGTAAGLTAGNVTTNANLTGDVTSVGNATTLATVNANVGTFGSSTSIPTFTVNGKGLITAASGNAVIAPAGTLTGTTLAANVVTTSITATGALNSGSITSGFGSIDVGADSITGGAGSFTTLAASGQIESNTSGTGLTGQLKLTRTSVGSRYVIIGGSSEIIFGDTDGSNGVTINNLARGTWASTGLAVTGTLSATGQVNTLSSASAELHLGGTAERIYRNGSTIVIYPANTAVGTFSATGLAVTGTLGASGNSTLSGLVQVAGTGTAPASGLGVELRGTATPSLTAYNRTTPAYLPMVYDALSHTFQANGGTVGAFATTGLAVTGTFSSTSTLSGSNFSGSHSGTSSGTNTGDNTVCTSGAATTAVTLLTTRTIGGSNFNGSADVTSFPSPGAIGGTTPAAVTCTTVTINNDLDHNGSNIGFFNTAVSAKLTVTGSKGGNAALASLLAHLNTYGLVVDSSS